MPGAGAAASFGNSHLSKSRSFPFLSGAFLIIGYFYRGPDSLDYLSPKYLNKMLPDLARVSAGGLVIFTGYPQQQKAKIANKLKVGQSICVVCKQIHSSCTQCCKCSTYYHAMCVSRAGYRMELHCLEKNGKQITKMVSCCAYHRKMAADEHDVPGCRKT